MRGRPGPLGLDVREGYRGQQGADGEKCRSADSELQGMPESQGEMEDSGDEG